MSNNHSTESTTRIMTGFQDKVVGQAVSTVLRPFLTISQVCITGAASGMGLATAKLLASRGAMISLADINQHALKTALQSLPDSSKHFSTVVDVRDRASVESWTSATKEKYGRIDGAVNMAGIICKTTSVADMSDEDWDNSFAVNTKGVFNCIRAQLKAMGTNGSIVSLPQTNRHYKQKC